MKHHLLIFIYRWFSHLNLQLLGWFPGQQARFGQGTSGYQSRKHLAIQPSVWGPEQALQAQQRKLVPLLWQRPSRHAWLWCFLRENGGFWGKTLVLSVLDHRFFCNRSLHKHSDLGKRCFLKATSPLMSPSISEIHFNCQPHRSSIIPDCPEGLPATAVCKGRT